MDYFSSRNARGVYPNTSTVFIYQRQYNLKVWYTMMKSYEFTPPMPVARARVSYWSKWLTRKFKKGITSLKHRSRRRLSKLKLTDLPTEILAEILGNLSATDLMIVSPLAAFSIDFKQALLLLDPPPVVLKVDTTSTRYKYTGTMDTFEAPTLIHFTNSSKILTYEETSTLFFDTLGYFNENKERTVIIQFVLGSLNDDVRMIALLNKLKLVNQSNFKFQLSIFKFLSWKTLSISIPKELGNFQWCRISIDSQPLIVETFCSEYYQNIPSLSMSWLSNCKELDSIKLGERLKIVARLDDLNFSKLREVRLDCWDRISCSYWSEFLNRHQQIEDLSLRHHLQLYKIENLPNLRKVELSGFKQSEEFTGFPHLLDKKVQLTVKGIPDSLVVELLSHNHESYPTVTIAPYMVLSDETKRILRSLKVRVLPITAYDYLCLKRYYGFGQN